MDKSFENVLSNFKSNVYHEFDIYENVKEKLKSNIIDGINDLMALLCHNVDISECNADYYGVCYKSIIYNQGNDGFDYVTFLGVDCEDGSEHYYTFDEIEDDVYLLVILWSAFIDVVGKSDKIINTF